MRITKNAKKFNQLIDFYKQGNQWIKLEFDVICCAWRTSQMGYGWNPFGRSKYSDVDLQCKYNEIDYVISKDNNTDNEYKSIGMLCDLGILIK